MMGPPPALLSLAGHGVQRSVKPFGQICYLIVVLAVLVLFGESATHTFEGSYGFVVEYCGGNGVSNDLEEHFRLEILDVKTFLQPA